jgi:hypothetical protein
MFFALLLGLGVSGNASQEGTPAPSWFEDIVLALAALLVVCIIAIAVESARLRRTPAAARAQAAQLAAQHRRTQRTHHLPSRHKAIWALGWLGMLVILAVAVISVPAPVDGVAFLAGADKTATFDPVSYQTYCQYGCTTSTDGYLETGGARISSSWPDVVPLGRPFQIREPAWRWGLGGALIDSDGTAVIAIVVSLLIELFGIFVLVQVVRLGRNWRRRRQGQILNSPAHVA